MPSRTPEAADGGVAVFRHAGPEAGSDETILAVDNSPRAAVECVAATGRLTNLPELAIELDLGSSASVENVLAALYARDGLHVATRLEGTCSCIFRDGEQRRLVAVAARTGHHRMYALAQSDAIRVGTRVESLLPFLRDRKLDEESVARHLCGRAIAPDASFFSSIRALAPGEMMVADCEGVRIKPYWSLRPAPTEPPRNADEWVKRCGDLLRSVVGSYLSHGRTGVALSGGVDSCAVAAFARRAAPDGEIAALRVELPGLPDADEAARSAQAARLLRLRDLPLDGSSLWPLSATVWPETRPGSPFCLLYSEFWKAILARADADGIDTVMTGAGGDEGFGGPIFSYFDQVARGRLLELTRQLQEHAASEGDRLPVALWRRLVRPVGGDILRALRGSRRRAAPWLARRYRKWVGVDEIPGVGRFAPLTARVKRLQSLREPTLVHTAETLAQMASRYGIEVCDPLADHRVTTFCLSVPPSVMCRAGKTKLVLRNSLRAVLPGPVVDGLGKTRPLPVAWRGLRHVEGAKVSELLTDMRSADLGFVEPAELRAHYREFVAGKHDDFGFWSALTFEAWLRQHF